MLRIATDSSSSRKKTRIVETRISLDIDDPRPVSVRGFCCLPVHFKIQDSLQKPPNNESPEKSVNKSEMRSSHSSDCMTKPTNGCAPNEDSDQPGHSPSLIRVFTLRSMGSCGPKLSSCGQRRL